MKPCYVRTFIFKAMGHPGCILPHLTKAMTLAIKWQVVLVLWVLQCLRVLFGRHSPRNTLPKTSISPPRHSWRWFSFSLSVGYLSSLEGTVFVQETTLSFDGKTSGTASKNQGRFLKFTPSFARTHKNSARDGIRYHIIWSYCWWFKNPANQLRLVVYPCLSMFIPLFTDVLYVLYIQTVVGLGISESWTVMSSLSFPRFWSSCLRRSGVLVRIVNPGVLYLDIPRTPQAAIVASGSRYGGVLRSLRCIYMSHSIHVWVYLPTIGVFLW